AEQHIFQPLGMVHSTFREPLPAALAGQMSAGHLYQGGQLRAQGFEYIHNFAPAGGLSSSATDMARFMIAHLNHGAYGAHRILREDTARQMHSRQFSPNPYLNGWGLGFYEIYGNGRRIIAHNGGTPTFQTDLWLLPDEKVGIFLSYNTPSGSALAELLRAFMDRYYPARLPELQPPSDFAQRAAAYTGRYRANRHAYTTLDKLAVLSSDISVAASANLLRINLGGEWSSWVEVAPDVFRRSDRGVTVAFARDANGRVTHLLTPGAAYKLAWFETARLHLWLLGLSVLGFLLAIVNALRHWKTDRSASVTSRRAHRLAAALGVINLLFLLGLALSLGGGINELVFAIPNSLRVALILPFLALALTPAVLYYAVKTWQAPGWSRYSRVQYTIIAALSVAFLWWLYFWNLIGYRFG
ncbi:MAG: serine hydrolase domain-containing protein, partial [Nevskiales bacterium]